MQGEGLSVIVHNTLKDTAQTKDAAFFYWVAWNKKKSYIVRHLCGNKYATNRQLNRFVTCMHESGV